MFAIARRVIAKTDSIVVIARPAKHLAGLIVATTRHDQYLCSFKGNTARPSEPNFTEQYQEPTYST